VATPTPGATTGPASEVSQYTATIAGTVTPNNWATTYYFEYGPTTAYGSKVPVPEASVKSETAAEEVKEKLTGLVPSTAYHYRLVANNSGNIKYGEDATFSTLAIPAPGATTGAATSVTWDSAVLAGTVTPNNWPTTYYFEYGETTAYGSKVPVPEASVKSETTAEEVEEQIAGLGPSKTYHYRLVANNSGNIKDGEDRTFTTSAVPPPTYKSAFGSEGSSPLAGPSAVALDSTGNVLVTDSSNNRVVEFSPTGIFVMTFGWGVTDGKSELEACTSNCKAGIAGSGPGQLNNPYGIVVANGHLWVVDNGNNRIEEFSAGGTYEQQAATANHPVAIASDPSGNVWVSDEAFGLIEEFSTTTGKKLGQVQAAYEGISGVAIDPQGDVWVATNHARIDEYSSKGEFKMTLGWGVQNGAEELQTCTKECTKGGIEGSHNGQLSCCSAGLTIAGGALWVADQNNNRVQEFSLTGEYIAPPNGEYVTQFGSPGSGTGQLSGPTGIAVAGGSASVVDRGNNRVEQWVVSE
jgi:hypothetical protein